MVSELIYGLIVKPIEFVIEIIFSLMYKVFLNPGIAIIFVSLTVQLLVLPMYKKTDMIQEQERMKQQKMKPWIDHIKSTFKGDEKFFMLKAYYALESYSPVSAITGSLSLLLQIPFFIAAYNYLSNLTILKGASFLMISDLGMPDNILNIGGLSVNILPILMTLLNIVSGIIYTKGFPIKEKIQTYGLALIFLVLLYNSPAGLVFYWTLNNLFSLIKNIFHKIIKNNRIILNAISALAGAAIFLFGFTSETVNRRKIVFLLIIFFAGLTPSILSFIEKMGFNKKVALMLREFDKKTTSIFNYSSVALTLLLGVLIPLSVISSSPIEFVSVNYGPIGLMLRTLAVFAGIIIIWIRIFYMLASNNGKNFIACSMFSITVIAAINYFFFGKQFGTLSTNLVFDDIPVYGRNAKILSLLIAIVVVLICAFAFLKKKSFLKRIGQIAVLSFLILGFTDSFTVLKDVPIFNAEKNSNYEKILPLSTDGKNVIVFMLDRAVGTYLPYFLEEKPELKELYDGFTYYPNTLSFGTKTNFASPALFGGYEYTPSKINERVDEKLVNKQNEALSVLPRLFKENGYNVTVTDPPYAGYSWIPDLSIYDKYEGIKAYTTIGKYSDSENKIYCEAYENSQKHNFLYYSLMKASPALIQSTIYGDGTYLSVEKAENGKIKKAFVDAYTVLTNLSNITDIKHDSSNNFLMMQNDTTHEPVYLQTPDYYPRKDTSSYENISLPSHIVNGLECKMENELQITHYQTNMAALLRIGEWLTYLKDMNVYDNTRIIIVADHGQRLLNQFVGYNMADKFDDIQMEIPAFNPLLLVKDFDAKGFYISDDFMTNADTPTLATQNIIDKPINPFTGNVITNKTKYEEPQIITSSVKYNTNENNGNIFDTTDGNWYSISDNIFDFNKWQKIRKGDK